MTRYLIEVVRWLWAPVYASLAQPRPVERAPVAWGGGSVRAGLQVSDALRQEIAARRAHELSATTYYDADTDHDVIAAVLRGVR